MGPAYLVGARSLLGPKLVVVREPDHAGKADNWERAVEEDETNQDAHILHVLPKIAERLKAGESVEPISVRELLRWQGAARRGYWVNIRIRRVLDDLGITTLPNFENVHIDQPVVLRLKEPGSLSDIANVEVQPLADDGIGIASGDGAATRGADPTIRLSRLAAANKHLVSVKPDDSLAQAVTQMLHYDYSQLPVMTTERDVKGMIGWKSIGARVCTGLKISTVRDAMDSAVEAPDDISIFAAIPIVMKHDYLLVRGADRRINGILTSADFGFQFQQLAEPFLLIGEIENYLRQLIEEGEFSIDEFASATDQRDGDRNAQSAEQMSFGEYIRLLDNDARWAKTRLKLDRRIFCGHLDDVRRIRNGVMHFDPDGIGEKDLEMLRRVAQMFQRLGAMDKG